MSKGNFKLVIIEEQIETLARRLLPEIKRYLGNEDVRKEFEEWQGCQQEKLAA